MCAILNFTYISVIPALSLIFVTLQSFKPTVVFQDCCAHWLAARNQEIAMLKMLQTIPTFLTLDLGKVYFFTTLGFTTRHKTVENCSTSNWYREAASTFLAAKIDNNIRPEWRNILQKQENISFTPCPFRYPYEQILP